MDSLKAALAEKRKAHHADLAQRGAESTKFVRRGEVRHVQEQREAQRRVEREAERAAYAAARQAETDAARARFHAHAHAHAAAPAAPAATAATAAAAATGASTSASAHNNSREDEHLSASATAPDVPGGSGDGDGDGADAGANFQVTDEEAMRRLRARGEPIRLFGESIKERRLRLRALELMEQRGDKYGQNDFMAALGRAEQTEAEKTLGQEEHKDGPPERVRGKGIDRTGANMETVLDLNLIRTDEAKVYPLIYYFLKGLLQDWADTLAARPDDVRSSVAGKMAAATQVQSEAYLKPLFKQLRKRVRPPGTTRTPETSGLRTSDWNEC